MENKQAAAAIAAGRAVLGIELGSTRIKAVLIGAHGVPIASGAHEWENRLEDGVWTYHLADVWQGIQGAYRALAGDVRQKYGVALQTLAGLGVSAMMHGYLPFDAAGQQLAAFRTWRNTSTAPAAAELSEAFHFNIPQRWSIAHLRQAMKNREPHVQDIAFLTTLAGYVHWQLTGQKVLGVGEASGMFPIDSATGDYDAAMLADFDALARADGYDLPLKKILPKVLCAGAGAGTLTPAGAALLDLTGALRPGVPLCPPEGDAGTGMAATNSVAARTGNVSAGTSVFAMVVLDHPLSAVYPQIDLVTTPTGKPVAMVHCNNCTSDLNAWAGMLGEFAAALGVSCDRGRLLTLLFQTAADKADPACGGLINYNYFSGEPITGLEEGRPLFLRTPNAQFTFANFARAQIYSALATLRIGMEILTGQEKVQIDSLLGHGGFFKTPGAGQRLMAAAMQTPVSVMETAGEGGPWGMALLAAFAVGRKPGQTLENYLATEIFAGNKGSSIAPDPADMRGFEIYMQQYKAGLAAERAALAVNGRGNTE